MWGENVLWRFHPKTKSTIKQELLNCDRKFGKFVSWKCLWKWFSGIPVHIMSNLNKFCPKNVLKSFLDFVTFFYYFPPGIPVHIISNLNKFCPKNVLKSFLDFVSFFYYFPIVISKISWNVSENFVKFLLRFPQNFINFVPLRCCHVHKFATFRKIFSKNFLLFP